MAFKTVPPLKAILLLKDVIPARGLQYSFQRPPGGHRQSVSRWNTRVQARKAGLTL